jgi:hypothetical protein
MNYYNIVRYYENGKQKIINTGLTLQEAKDHCKKPNTEGKTRKGIKWFDGFIKA